MLLLIDNYDSFVYNLARYFAELGVETRVVRNDAISLKQIDRLAPAGIVLSPGPCTPSEAGISLDVVREFGPRLPLLGVCLGHQSIAQALGGRVIRAPEPVHGRTSLVEHAGTGLFQELPRPLRVARYHSLLVDTNTLPAELTVTATTVADRLCMALAHRDWPTFGVQFHPEAVLTQSGYALLRNFLAAAHIPCTEPIPADPWDRPAENADWQPRLGGQALHW